MRDRYIIEIAIGPKYKLIKAYNRGKRCWAIIPGHRYTLSNGLSVFDWNWTQKALLESISNYFNTPRKEV
jgi:hypothetical protein